LRLRAGEDELALLTTLAHFATAIDVEVTELNAGGVLAGRRDDEHVLHPMSHASVRVPCGSRWWPTPTSCGTYGSSRRYRHPKRWGAFPISGELYAFSIAGVDQAGLLERADELGVLHGCAAEMAASGRGRVVLAFGEAGIGKTALLRQFRDELPRRVTRLWGTCDALFTPRPLGPLLEPAADLGGEPKALLAEGAKPFDVATSLVESLRAIAPAVLILEDLHWADEATLDVVRVIARRAAEAGLLLVLSYRSDELHRDHPLRMVLGELPSGDEVTRLELRALSPGTVAELADGLGFDIAELYERTSGNPFFVTETLAAGDTRVPETVRDAVHARIARLSPGGRALLDAVAVVPQRAEVWLLEALTDGALGGLDECLRSGVLRSEADGVVFRHELARLAVEESLAPDRAVDLHRRALAALADPTLGSPDLTRLAHHAEAAGDGPAVLRYAPAAGERAADLGSPREAQHHYWRALRFAAGIDPHARADLLERFAEHAYLSDMRAEAVGAIDEAIAIHRRAGNKLREGGALRLRARLLACIGRAHEALETVREAITVLEQAPPSVELARAYSGLSGLSMLSYDLESAVHWGARAIALADEVGDRQALVHALNNVGSAELTFGNPAGQAKLERSLELARQWRLATDAGRAYINLSDSLRLCGRWREALIWIERGIDYTRELGLEAWFKCLIGARGAVELALGRWDDAAATAQTILDGPRDQVIGPRSDALVTLALVRARRGDPGYWPLLDEALDTATAAEDLQLLAPVAAARAEAAWLEGRPEIIGAETEYAYDTACRLGEPTFAGWLACWRARAGLPVEPPDGLPERCRLQLAGEPEAAAELFRTEGADYDAAIAVVASDNGALLRDALDQLRALGAKPAGALVSRRLRELGERRVPRGPRASTSANPARLTNRELEVLPLLAEGLRNADIAKRLVLSQKTVDHHVSAILRKLGVSTRGQAGAAAGRLGLLTKTSARAPR
jgi:DNA-binding CsgD family transcriptional regulator/tetratricopeptide (TPR) repeat protein